MRTDRSKQARPALGLSRALVKEIWPNSRGVETSLRSSARAGPCGVSKASAHAAIPAGVCRPAQTAYTLSAWDHYR